MPLINSLAADSELPCRSRKKPAARPTDPVIPDPACFRASEAPRSHPWIVQDGHVGRLEFDCAVAIGAQPRQRLITLHAIPGTGTRERLRLLAESLPGGQNDG
ncbi:hypothetical protein [Amycolatopsis sp. NPDC051061]|uniref:hypothetical protein n=1 Tax=Amycolatopsis sp. NPDC051061 TaxID=3155042 RepID=UPI00344B0031